MVNPLDLAALDELASLTGLDIDPLLATEEDVRDAIFRAFGAYDDLGELVGEAIKGVDMEGLKVATADEDQPVNVIELKEVVEGAPVIKLANALSPGRSPCARRTFTSSPTPARSACGCASMDCSRRS